jgi:hypothetical protein
MESEAPTDAKVRVFVFDQAQWKREVKQSSLVLVPQLHVSPLEFIALDNERMIPQQAASTLTSVDDIEAFIHSKELGGKQYLWAIDLPLHARRDVMRELSLMGITAGSLFPGLDGACEELRERNFPRWRI